MCAHVPACMQMSVCLHVCIHVYMYAHTCTSDPHWGMCLWVRGESKRPSSIPDLCSPNGVSKKAVEWVAKLGSYSPGPASSHVFPDRCCHLCILGRKASHRQLKWSTWTGILLFGLCSSCFLYPLTLPTHNWLTLSCDFRLNALL
jgi:hypothetical protein